MGLIGIARNFLNKSVGAGQDNAAEDVITTKRTLDHVGYYDDDDTDNEILTTAMDQGIRGFQRDHGLKQDGYMRPRGETENALVARASGRSSDAVSSADNETDLIGFGGTVTGTAEPRRNRKQRNDPNSIKALAEALAARKPKPKPKQQQQNDTAAAGSFGQLAQNVDATGRPLRGEDAEPVPEEVKQLRKKTDEKESDAPSPARKPEMIAATAKGNEILDFIGQLESSDNYNIIYGNEEKPLTKMTIKEVQKLQEKMIDEGRGSSAVGRYQFLKGTLKEAVDKLGVDENAIFDEALQDKLARSRLEYRGFEKYKAGKINTEEFIKGLANEWAALPSNPSNSSRYKGVLNNKVLTDFKTLKDLLEKQ